MTENGDKEIKNDWKDKLKNRMDESRKINIDEPRVKIVEMQLDAIKALADESKLIFSELSWQETQDVSRALVFSNNPLPNINDKLSKSKIEYELKLPVLKEFITEMMIQRHKVDRKRVDEFIRALEAMSRPAPPDVEDRKVVPRKLF